MNIPKQVVAGRYAVAYVNTFDEQLNKDAIAHIKQAIPFFKGHAQALYFLTVPTIGLEQKLMVMTNIMHTLQMPPSLDKLLSLLIHQKRAALWCDVLEAVVTYYYKKHDIIEAVVESFPELSDADKQTIEQSFSFAVASYGYDGISRDTTTFKPLSASRFKDVLYTYKVCPELLAGICIKTDNLMWEDSIAQKLRAVRAAVLEPYKG